MQICTIAPAACAANCAASPRPGHAARPLSRSINPRTQHGVPYAASQRVRSGAAAGHEAAAGPPPAAAVQPPRPPEVPVVMHLPIMLRLLAQGLNVEDMQLLWSRDYGPFVEWQLVSTGSGEWVVCCCAP